MPKKQSNQIVVKQPGVIGGLKWYWWVLIGIAGVFILSSLVATITTAATGGGSPLGNLMTDMSTALLGLADGLLNLAEKSPLTYILIAAWALPFVGTGAAAMIKAYKAHAQDKTNSELNKEAGLDPESLQESNEEIKSKNPESTVEEIKAATEVNALAKTQTNLGKTLQELKENNILTTEQVNQINQAAATDTIEGMTEEQRKANEKAKKGQLENVDPVTET